MSIRKEKPYYNCGSITKENVRDIFSNTNKEYKFAVLFDQSVNDVGSRVVEKYGIPTIEYVKDSYICQQINFYKTMDEAKECAMMLPKITNKNYSNAFIVCRKDE